MGRQFHPVRERVALATTSSRLAVFDLDRTLVRGSSLVRLGRALTAAGLLPRRRLLGAALGEASFRLRGASDDEVIDLRDRALRAVAGLDRRDLAPILDLVADELVEEMTPGARYLIEQHLDSGDFCLILSASPQDLVEAISHRLGMHRGVGTRVVVENHLLTGEIDGTFCYAEGKLDRLHAALGRVELDDAWAYADSMSDLPLLEAVGHPVAVNPDSSLRRHAIDAGWPILRVA